jgi:hypothetical protein
MIQSRVPHQIAETTAESGFWIKGTENQALESSVHQCSGAHRARLEGNVHGASFKPPAVHSPRRIGYRLELGMGQRITIALAPIPPSTKQRISSHYYRTHRDFALFGSSSRLRQRFGHPPFIRADILH